MFIYLFTTLLLPASFAIEGGNAVDRSSPLASVSVSLADNSTGQLQRTFCSGTLVSTHALVTAAHCVYGKNPAQLVVEFGTDGLTSSLFRPISQIVIPREYQAYDSQLPGMRDAHDLAVLSFSGDLPQGFKPAIMVDAELVSASEGLIFSVAGYGAPVKGSLHTCTTVLQQSNFSRSEFQLLESPQCALGVGDSGGSVYQIQNQNVYLYGIHNWGWHDQNGHPAYSVETKLSFYGPWIRTLALF